MGQHLSVQQRIKRIARHFTGCHYSFANWAQLNTIIDAVDKPTICYILPPSGVLHTKHMATTIVDRPLTQIAFLAPTDLDFDGEKNDDIVELMKLLMIMFIKELNRSGLFEPIDDVDIQYQVPYDTMDENVTGVLVTLPLYEIPDTMCQMPDAFGYVDEIDDDE